MSSSTQSINDKNFIMQITRQSTPAATPTITRPLDIYKQHDRRETDRDIVSDNFRYSRLGLTTKDNMRKDRFLKFASQE